MESKSHWYDSIGWRCPLSRSKAVQEVGVGVVITWVVAPSCTSFTSTVTGTVTKGQLNLTVFQFGVYMLTFVVYMLLALRVRIMYI